MKTIYASALMGLSLLFSGCQPEKPTGEVSTIATFQWFDYQGQDAVFAEPLAKGSYQNPVAAGFSLIPALPAVVMTITWCCLRFPIHRAYQFYTARIW